MSRRQQLVDAIEARLGTIVAAQTVSIHGGTSYTYQNTIKGVYPWRKTPFNQGELPAIEFWDANSEDGPGPSGQHEHRLPIVLQVSVGGSQPASVARSLMEDIVACIGVDPRWSKLANWTDITGHGLMIEKAGDVIAGAQILFTIRYCTPLWRL